MSDFVHSDLDPWGFLECVQADRDRYDGFNLLVAANDELLHYANVSDAITELAPGVHGLSNHLLNTPWPKVERGKAALRSLLAGDLDELVAGLFNALNDAGPAADKDLPRTGIPLEWERRLASIFIATPDYGTRASTVVLMERSGKINLTERNFGPDGIPGDTCALQFSAASGAWTFV